MGFRPLHQTAVALVIATLLLIASGPYGYMHRGMAVAATVLTVAWTALLWMTDRRPALRGLSVAAIATLMGEGWLGVLAGYRPAPALAGVLHACLGQIFFGLTAIMALLTSRAWTQAPAIAYDPGWPSLRSLSIFTAGVLLAQAISGAAYRHRALGVIPHIVGALLVTAVVLVVSIFVLSQHSGNPELRRPALALLALAFLEIFLGIALYSAMLLNARGARLPGLEATFAALHAAGGALTLAAGAVFAIEVSRHIQKPGALALNNASGASGAGPGLSLAP